MNESTTGKDSKRRWFVASLVLFIASVAGIGVLWVQSLPKFNIVEGKISVSNCELPLPTYAIGVCPKLFCKKEILESGLFPQHSQIGFNKAKPSADQFLAGAVRYYEADTTNLITRDFVCELDGYQVTGMSFL